MKKESNMEYLAHHCEMQKIVPGSEDRPDFLLNTEYTVKLEYVVQ